MKKARPSKPQKGLAILLPLLFSGVFQQVVLAATSISVEIDNRDPVVKPDPHLPYVNIEGEYKFPTEKDGQKLIIARGDDPKKPARVEADDSGRQDRLILTNAVICTQRGGQFEHKIVFWATFDPLPPSKSGSRDTITFLLSADEATISKDGKPAKGDEVRARGSIQHSAETGEQFYVTEDADPFLYTLIHQDDAGFFKSPPKRTRRFAAKDLTSPRTLIVELWFKLRSRDDVLVFPSTGGLSLKAFEKAKSGIISGDPSGGTRRTQALSVSACGGKQHRPTGTTGR